MMNRILFLIIAFTLTLSGLKAQFVDVVNPYNGPIQAFENQGNSLIVADKGDSSAFFDNQIMLRWVNENGTVSFSNKYRNTNVFDTAFTVVGVTQFNNNVYVLARGAVSGVQRDRVLHYDTTTKVWNSLAGFSNYVDAVLSNSEAHVLKAFDGNVLIAGSMYDVGQNNRILTYFTNGDSVNTVAMVDTMVKGMVVRNNELYVWGLYTNTSGTPTGGLIRFPNSLTWQDPDANDNSRRYQHLSWISASEMVIQDGNNDIYHVNNGTLVPMPNTFGTLYSAVKFGNRLFATSLNTRSSILVYEDVLKSWIQIDTSDFNIAHYLSPVNNSMLHTSLKSFGYRNKLFTRLGVILKSNVYLDLNENCQRDVNEPGIKGIAIRERNGAFAIFTDGDGRSFQYVDPGGYWMDTVAGLQNYAKNICSSDSITIATNVDTVYYDVPYKLVDPTKSIEAYIHAEIGFRARQGFTERYSIRVKNVGATVKSCDYFIRIPENFHLVSLSSPILDSIPKQYKINISLNPQEEKFFTLRCLTPVNSVPMRWHQVEFFSDSNCNLEIAEFVRVQVRGAYDPNDKQSSEDALMPKETKKLRYHIRFQNTGTDTAYRVRIIDTIDRNLAMNLIRVRTASHGHRVEVLHEAGSPVYALHFIFDNILLPDSNTDEAGSHGYIQYEVSLKNGFSDKDTVFNTAHIFFDYQSAIITNTVENSFDTSGGSFVPPSKDYSHLIQLYPNPTTSELHIRNSLGRPLNLLVMDSRGRVVGYSHCGPLGESNFNCETLAQGIYYMMSSDKLIRKRFVVVKE